MIHEWEKENQKPVDEPPYMFFNASLRETFEKVERAKQEWESAIDSLPELICITDHQGKIIRANRTIEHWNLGQVVSIKDRSFHEVLHPGCNNQGCYLDSFFWQSTRKNLTDQPNQFETFDAILDRHIVIKIHPVTAKRETKSRTFAIIVQDITQRQMMEEALRQIVNSVHEGLLLLDAGLRVVLANPIAKQYLKILLDDDLDAPLKILGGRPILELLGSPPERMSLHEIVIDGPIHHIFELKAYAMESEVLSGGWVLVLRDVTKERDERDYILAQERLATVGQLAAGIAHDFNNIMAVIVLYSGMLLKKLDLSEKDRDRLTVIHDQTEHATKLIAQILDFSRRSMIERKPADLLPFVKKLLKLMERTLPESIDIKLTYNDEDYIVNADLVRLQQAIMNMAVNAQHAMPDGGTLHTDLSRETIEPGREPPLPEMPPGDYVRIAVSDTGTGISKEHLPHIFEPFFSTKEPGMGTGLGLSQVYGIVKQHDGYIDVSSQLDHGTTFTIYFPVAELPGTGPLDKKDAPMVEGGQETILIVEDDEAVGDALTDTLTIYGYKVLLTKNGQEALTVYNQQGEEIALVISDVVMPVMGGQELNKALREKDPDIKMLVITGYSWDWSDKKFYEQGGIAWLEKPFSDMQLLTAIRSALDE